MPGGKIRDVKAEVLPPDDCNTRPGMDRLVKVLSSIEADLKSIAISVKRIADHSEANKGGQIGDAATGFLKNLFSPESDRGGRKS